MVDFVNFKRYNKQTFGKRWDGSVLNIVLVEPEIPQNCGQHRAHLRRDRFSGLHLVTPARLRHFRPRRQARGAGLLASGRASATYENLADLFEQHPEAAADLLARHDQGARRTTARPNLTSDCWLFFGKETAGLPEDFRLAHYERCIRLPMRAEARSLNLSNSVAILTYEALKQLGFPGLKGTGEMAEQPDCIA